MASYWVQWRLKITEPRLFIHPLFRHRSKKTSKLHVTGLCEGNSPVTGEFTAQRASNTENVSIWWWMNHWYPGPSFNIQTVFPGIGIPIIKIMQPWCHLGKNFYVGNLTFLYRDGLLCVLWYVSLLTMVTWTVWSFIMDWSCLDNVV